MILLGSFVRTLAALCCTSIGMGFAADIIVNTPVDQSDSPAGLKISLREAVRDAGAEDRVVFDATIFADQAPVITLTSEIEIDQQVEVDAGDLGGKIIVSGGGTSRLFSISDTGSLILNGLVLTDGGGAGATQDGDGGAIYNDGTLCITECTLRGNTAGSGGAIFNRGSLARTLEVSHSTISGNVASSGAGGGIFNDGALTVTQSTLVGNSANTSGGAIYNLKTLTLTQSTLAENLAPLGGGVGVFDGSRTSVLNSIVAGNLTAPGGVDTDIGFNGSPPPAFNFTLTEPNLIGSNHSVAEFFPEGPLVGTPEFPLDPQLSPQGDYGGPTESMALRAGSPAVDMSFSSTMTRDQRGFERVLGSAADLGAVEASAGKFNPDGFTLYGNLSNAAAAPGSIVRFQISADPEFLANVSTYAGVADSPDLEEGSRHSAQLNSPTGVAQDSEGNFFIADTGNHRIRMVSPGGGVSTIAGSGEGIAGYGFSDGPGISAKFAFPAGLTVGPAGNIYVSDTFNHRIRKLTRPQIAGQPWTVTTLAGSAIAGYRDGAGSSAQFNRPQGIVLDADGNIFVADAFNFRIRKITPDGSVVSTYAGIGDPTLEGCSTNGTVQVTCSSTDSLSVGWQISGSTIPDGATIAVITSPTTFDLSVAATGSQSGLTLKGHFEGDRISATFNYPYGLAFNEAGTKLYVADRDNNRIRQITVDQPGLPLIRGVVSTFAGTGEAGSTDDPEVGPSGSASFRSPVALAVDRDDNLYVADEFNHAIRRISSVGLVSTVAGLGFGSNGEANGRADVASFDCPVGLAVDRVILDGSLIVADTQNHLLRRVVIKPTEVDAVVGVPDPLTGLTPISALINAEALGLNPDTIYYTRWTTSASVIPNVQPSGQRFYLFDVPGIETLAESEVMPDLAKLNASVDPNGDTTHVVFEISTDPGLASPTIVTVDSSLYGLPGESHQDVNIWMVPQAPGDTVYFRAVATNARGTTVGQTLSFTFPVTEVETSPASLVSRHDVQFNGGVNAMGASTSVRFEYSTTSDLSDPWQVSTRAGSGVPGFVDSSDPLASEFHSAEGVAVSGDSVFIADRLNHRIRKVSADGAVSTFAGSTVGFADGVGGAAQFDHPTGIAADGAGSLFVADQHNHRIRKINIATQEVTTLAGSSTAGFVDAVGTAAQFLFPKGVVVDSSGNVFVSDEGNHSIRKISSPDQSVSTVAGTGDAGFVDGGVGVSQLRSPGALACNDAGELFVADTGNHAIRVISSSGLVSTLSGTGTAGDHDGQGETATFSSPTGITLLGEGLVITDRDNHLIRHVSADGQTSTIAGSGDEGHFDSPVGFLYPATTATFNLPSGIASDASGSLWLTEEGNHGLRKLSRFPLPVADVPGNLSGVSPEDVDVSITGLLAGTRYYFRAIGANAVGEIQGEILEFTTLRNQEIVVFDGPDTSSLSIENGQDAAVDFGVTPRGVPVTRQFTVLNSGEWDLNLSALSGPAGFGVSFAAGVLAPGDSLGFEVTLEALDGAILSGDLVITSDDPEQGVFTVPLQGEVKNPPVVTILAAGGDAGSVMEALIDPQNSSTTVGFEYSTDPDVNGFDVTTLAGSSSGYAEGTGTDAQFSQPSGVVRDSAGNVFVADTLNHCIRKITRDGVSRIFAGAAGESGYVDGSPENSRFNEPVGIVRRGDGVLFVSDSKNHRVREISPTGNVSTYAGSGEANFTDGVGSAARFNHPLGLAIDEAGILYVADQLNHRVRKIALDQTVSSLAGTGAGGVLSQPSGIAVAASGEVYLTEVSAHHILKITSTGAVSVFAGDTSGFNDAVGTGARFANPVGLAIDSGSVLYVADRGNHRIRTVSLSSGEVETFAGTGVAGSLDGDSNLAEFDEPVSVMVGSGRELTVGEAGNSVIRQIRSTTVLIEMEAALDGSLGETLVSHPLEGLDGGTVYYYRAFATNIGGTTFGSILPIIGMSAQSFSAWQIENFGVDASNDLIGGPNADPSGDGVSNLLKYAFLLDPNIRSQEGLPVVGGDGSVVSITYTRLLNTTELIYTAEWSQDMVNWNSVDVTETILSSTAESEEVVASVPRGVAPVKFMCIRITLK